MTAHALWIEPAADSRRLTIPLSGVPDGLETFTLTDPPRLVIDVRGAAVLGRRLPARLLLTDEVVSAVRTAIHDDTLRIVLDLRRDGAAPSVRLEGTALVAALGERRPGAPPAPAPAAPADGRVEERDPSGPLHLDVQFILDAAGRGASLFNPEVRPGDVITVLPAGSFQVDGWVGRPGSYPVTRGLTCAGAVSAAGGYLFPADPHRVVVKRIIGAGEQRLFTVDLDAIAAGRAPDFPLADGDIIRVPAQTSLLVPWGVWSVVSAVGRVGVTALTF